MDESFILNELKSLILSKTGIRTITPADCKRISIEISKTLNKNVSETTIKRLFGFAMVKHNFSKFTLTTLSEYVSEEYLETRGTNVQLSRHETVHDWKDIHDKASKITSFTLKSIKNRSGMPYHLTISRKFAEHDFEYFFKSDYTFTSFISQPGYGRTILLSHLAEIFLNKSNPVYQDSTILFITAYSFFNKENSTLSLEDQLKAQMGIHSKESLINYANQNYNSTGGKLIIFLDGFSELVLKRELKKQLFESIINFICSIEDIKSIKLVMSMRSTTWIRFYDCIRHSAYLKTKWFPGNYFNLNDVSNVPPLTEREVDLILSKIAPLDVDCVNPKLKAQLKFPFHIQLYYQLKEEDPNFNYSTNITFFELISRFIQEKIYRSNYYTEKILFLKKVIQLTDYGKKGSSVLKDDLISELAAFKNAYMELLSEGILMEEKSQEEFLPKEFVRFIHPHIFEYFLFIELLEKFHLKVDYNFFEYIGQEYKNTGSRFQLLQWTIRFVIRIGDFKSLTNVFDIDLNNYEKNYLTLFIAENLEYRNKYSPETTRLLKEHQLHDSIIKELVKFDFIDSYYKEAITILIQVVDTDHNLYIYKSLLSIFDILSLDAEALKSRLEDLSKFKTDRWIVDPYQIVNLIHKKINDTYADGESFIDDYEHVISNQTISFENEIAPQKAISYLMITLLNMFYGDQRKVMNIIGLISKKHPRIFAQRSSYSAFMLSVLGYACSKLKPGKKADQMENILTLLYHNKSRFKITKYTELMILLMQANQMKNRGEYLIALQRGQECLQIFKRNHLNLNTLLAYNLMIEIFMEMKDDIKANEYRYERLCFLEDNHISSKIFTLLPESRKGF